MTKNGIIYWFSIVWALLLVGLEFTNLFTVVAEGGKIGAKDPHSGYTLEFATYVVCAIILVLDRSNITRLLQQGIFRWTLAVIALFTWGMLVRTFYAPAGLDAYLFVRTFGLQMNALGFILACAIIFDQTGVLAVVKPAVAVATLFAISLNLYEVFHPGTFSETPGRAAGLYLNSNSSGQTLVLGCLVSLMAMNRRWREIFLLVTGAGVVATFSRMAIAAFGIVLIGALFGRVLSVRRLVLGGCLACAFYLALGIGMSLRGSLTWNDSNFARLRFETNDASAAERFRLDRKMFAEFEEAPLLGHGFGTDDYWGDITAHNAFLSMLANYGIAGFFVIPALVLSVRRRSWDWRAFALAFVLCSLFSQMILLEPFTLIIIAIEAAECAHAKSLVGFARAVS